MEGRNHRPGAGSATYCDEVLTIRVTGTIEKKDDEFAAPTVSIPLHPDPRSVLGEMRHHS